MIRGAVIVWCISSIFFLLDMTNGVQIHNWIKQNGNIIADSEIVLYNNIITK